MDIAISAGVGRVVAGILMLADNGTVSAGDHAFQGLGDKLEVREYADPVLLAPIPSG